MANDDQQPPRPDQRQYVRGALVAYDPKSKKKKTVPFQYNPAELSRSLKPRTYADGVGSSEYTGAAEQEISLTVQLQGVDTMVAKTKKGKTNIAARGVYAHLAALELLLYPKTDKIDQYRKDIAKGTKGAVPQVANLTWFVWGEQRVLPVKLTSFEVSETFFNVALSPVMASVKLSLQVQNIFDAPEDSYQMLLSYQKNLEQMVADQSGEVYGSQSQTGADY